MPSSIADYTSIATATGTSWVDVGTAAGTLLLAFFAAWSAWQAKSLAKAQHERSEAEQASRVYNTPVPINGNAARLRVPAIEIVNASNLPIYTVSAVVKPIYRIDRVNEWDVEPWMSKYGNKSDELWEAAVMPGETIKRYIEVGVLTWKWGWEEISQGSSEHTYRLPDHVGGPAFTVELTFRDASNRWWTRDSDGVLSRSSERKL